MFRCFCGGLLEWTWGVIYVGVFKSKEVCERKIEANQMVEGEKRLGGVPLQGAPPMIFWASRTSRWDRGAPDAYYDEIFTSLKL
jgi:hypothetical protein